MNDPFANVAPAYGRVGGFHADRVILPSVRDQRLVTIRRGGTLTDADHKLLALWAAACAEHVLHLFEEDLSADPLLFHTRREELEVGSQQSGHKPNNLPDILLAGHPVA